MIIVFNLHKILVETLSRFAVGQRPDGGAHGWLMWACEREGTPTPAVKK